MASQRILFSFTKNIVWLHKEYCLASQRILFGFTRKHPSHLNEVSITPQRSIHHTSTKPPSHLNEASLVGEGLGWGQYLSHRQDITDPTPAPPLDGRGVAAPSCATCPDFLKWTPVWLHKEYCLASQRILFGFTKNIVWLHKEYCLASQGSIHHTSTKYPSHLNEVSITPQRSLRHISTKPPL